MKYFVCGTIEYEIEIDTDSPAFAALNENRTPTHKENSRIIAEAQNLIYQALNGDNPAILLLDTNIDTIEGENSVVTY